MNSVKYAAKYAAVATCLLSLTGCETLMTRGEVREQEQKRHMESKVENLQKTTADVNNRFSEIEADLRSLNGRVEVLENKQAQFGQEREKLRMAGEQSNSENGKRIQILQEEIVRMQEQMGALTAELNAMRSAVAQEVSAPAQAKKDLFDSAEESFDKKEWRKAILNYQKFRDTNPKHKKFADATYKIGVSFQELGMKDEARTFFDEVVGKFPNSPEAKRAKTRLKNLKK